MASIFCYQFYLLEIEYHLLIRRMMFFVEKRIRKASRHLLFEPHDKKLRDQFIRRASDILEDMDEIKNNEEKPSNPSLEEEKKEPVIFHDCNPSDDTITKAFWKDKMT